MPTFLEKCTLFFNEILGIRCDIDYFNPLAHNYDTGYTLGGYTIIRIPGHDCLVIIWSANNCIFANLDTQITYIAVYSSQTHGILKNARFYPELRQLKLLFLGSRDVSKPTTDIYSQKYFITEVYVLDYEQMSMHYKSNNIVSYSNGSAPVI